MFLSLLTHDLITRNSTLLNLQNILFRLKEGDEATYKEIFHEYYPLMVSFANKILKDLDSSKEIAQNVFVKLYEKRHKIEITSSLKSYLFKITYNDCLNYIKHKQISDSHNEKFTTQYDTTDFQEFAEQSEQEKKIFNAIENLPTQCKAIFKQSRLDGKKNSEIASELQISIRTVETQISKALKIIRQAVAFFI